MSRDTTSLLLPRNIDPDLMPTGIRPSTACWTRKAIEMVDPKRYLFHERGTGEVVDFDRGIGQRGHDMEALILGRKFGLSTHGMGRVLLGQRLKRAPLDGGGRVATQVPIVFRGGTSHIDWVITGGAGAYGDIPDRDGVWELKSLSKHTMPLDEHYEVVKLRILLAEEAGMELPGPWRLLIADPASYRVHGPFTVHLDRDSRAALTDKLDRLRVVLARLNEVNTRDPFAFQGLECTCGVCFDACAMEASTAVAALLARYAAAAEVVEEAETEDVAFARADMAAAKQQLKEILAPGQRVEPVAGWQARMTDPKVTTKVDWGRADKAGLLARVVGQEAYDDLRRVMQAEGYVKEGVGTAALYVERAVVTVDEAAA